MASHACGTLPLGPEHLALGGFGLQNWGLSVSLASLVLPLKILFCSFLKILFISAGDGAQGLASAIPITFHHQGVLRSTMIYFCFSCVPLPPLDPKLKGQTMTPGSVVYHRQSQMLLVHCKVR